MATYKERTTPDITIYRPSLTGESEAVLTVPITEDSKRVFSLMTEDYIELHFTLAEAVAVEVGDYVDDELFGRFIVTTKQMPSYDTATGGYDYTLKLEREYRKWNNKVFMLTAVITGGDRVRKEVNWSLTDHMESHVEEIINNLSVIGDGHCTYDISGAEKSAEVKNLTYTGTSILDALTAIADAYECEWWVTYDTLGTATIHLGKCEDSDSEEQTLSLETNVESMSMQDDSSTYCNRLLAFGSTTNMPSSYRKSLTFKVAETRDVGSGRIDYLPDKELTMDMLAGGSYGTVGFVKQSTAYPNKSVYINLKATTSSDGSRQLTGKTKNAPANEIKTRGGTVAFSGLFTYKTHLTVTQSLTLSPITYTLEVFAEDDDGNSVGTILTDSQTVTSLTEGTTSMDGYLSILLDFDETEIKLSSGTFHIVMQITIQGGKNLATSHLDSIDGASAESCITIEDGTTTKSGNITIGKTGNAYSVTFYKSTYASMAGRTVLYFDTASHVTETMEVGDEFTIDIYDGEQQGLLIHRIPMSWWASDYDNPSSLTQIGENRLMLPVETNGSLQNESGLTADQTVEMAVAFEGIYPRCVLTVTDVTTETKHTQEEYEDGSKTTWDWTQYKLAAKNINGGTFRFNKSFIKDGETLKIKFLTEKEEQEAYDELGITDYTQTGEYKLAGMTFEVNFKNLSQLYTIVRNDDYGAMFPNDTLRPAIGDPFILVGWDVRAMESLGLISAAEKRLQAAAKAYLKAIKEDQFTFTCSMMSEPPEGDDRNTISFHTSADEPFYTKAGLPFRLKTGTSWYDLMDEGTRICIQHESLTEDKHSRIIGYQYKLDIPYDSPQYTVGDTDAYSRIKKMEKEITKLGGN